MLVRFTKCKPIIFFIDICRILSNTEGGVSMDGYFINNKNNTGILNIEIKNIAALKDLVEKAKKEADQLSETINQLENFDLKIVVSAETIKPDQW